MGHTPESMTVDVDGHVAQVTLIGPGKGNAMGPAFWAELPEVFTSLDADPDVRAIVLTGSGRNFSYGLDLAAMGAELPGPDAGAKSRSDFHKRLQKMQGAISAVADCRTPTIASVHGWCIGGGVDLISAVDIRYASADAKFSVREVKLAIVADVGSLARLPLILMNSFRTRQDRDLELKTATHTYAKPGPYMVRLTVTEATAKRAGMRRRLSTTDSTVATSLASSTMQTKRSARSATIRPVTGPVERPIWPWPKAT